MATAFDSLQLCAFNGLEFAISRCTITGGMREHTHTYPHVPGGDLERLGRELYEVEFDAIFSAITKRYPDAWPGTIGLLRADFENGVTADLDIPTVGTIKAMCTSWVEEADFAKQRDGVRVRLKFKEDLASALLVQEALTIQFQNISAPAARLIIEAEAAGGFGDVFDDITELCGEIQAFKDGFELQADTYSQKVQGAVAAVQKLDAEIQELNEPENFPVVEALHDIGFVATQILDDLARKTQQIVTLVTEADVAASDLARGLYGDTKRAAEIIQLNAFRDAFLIPRGTTFRAYAA